MTYLTTAEAWRAVCDHHAARPAGAESCTLGDHTIVRPAGAQPSPPCLYILGFDGGETELVSPKTSRPDRPTRSATVWFNLCQRAANVLGVDAYIIMERCYWVAPTSACSAPASALKPPYGTCCACMRPPI